MSYARNQKNRDRQARQRERLRRELAYYQNNTFAPEEKEAIDRKIKILQRDLDQNGIPGTYR